MYRQINIAFILLITAFSPHVSRGDMYKDLLVEHSYLGAKQKAEELGKPYIVQFTAAWCTPCTWLDEKIFQDQELVSVINENYVFVLMDIDKFEGYNIKQFFQVNNIPSTLIFSEKHELLFRTDLPLNREKFLSLLKSLQDPEKRSPIPIDKISSMMINRSSPAKNIVNTSSPTVYSDLLEDSVRPEPPSSFGGQVYAIQVGAYSTLENAQARELEVRGLSNEETFITRQDEIDRKIYKVYVGHFDTERSMLHVKTHLSRLAIEGWGKKITLTEKI